MKKIELSQGMVALVDDEDFERVSAINWCYKDKYGIRKGKGLGYASHAIYLGLVDGKSKKKKSLYA